MKRVGLFLILILFFANKILAYPQSLGRIDEVQTIPMVLNAFGMKGSRLYIVDANKSELMIYDIAQGYWHASGIRVSSRRSIKDIYVDESRIHLLDAKNNSILSYDLQGTLINEIKTKGVKELNFKKASRLLVNYQGYVYVMDSRKLYAFTKEGMLIATADLEKPVSMSLGTDQVIRVLQHTKKGSQVALYDLNLVCLSKTNVPNAGRKNNFIIDMAVNQWGELHVINRAPVGIDKLGPDARQIPGSKFGSLNKSSANGAFQAPSLLKSGDFSEASIIAIYDSKQEAIHLFQDTEPAVNKLLLRPTYTVRPELGESEVPLAQDFLPLKDSFYMICDMPNPKIKAKAKTTYGPAIVCQNRTGKIRFVSHLRQQNKLIKSFSALAISEDKLYVLDKKANLVHVFGADDGLYKELSIGGKGSQEGSLKAPSSVVVGEDKLIYVADTGNCRISIFNQQGLYLSNIPLLKPKQRPILLRSYWQDLYCLTDDALILWIPLSGEKIVQQQISAASISSFDILPSGRIALVDGKAQKLRIYNGKVKEYEYFSQSSKAEFPHFKSIYLIRYDEVNQQLVIMDKAVKKTRVLKFYAALNTKQSIILDLNESLQTVLSWAAEPGIDHWTIQARDEKGTTSSNSSEPRHIVENPMNSVVSYTICPVAADGKSGIVSTEVKDYFSHARYLKAEGQYLAAVEAMQSAKNSMLNPQIDQQIIEIYLAEAGVQEEAKNYKLVLDHLDAAAAISGTTADIALRKVHIHKITKEYWIGIKYLEGVNYKEDPSLLREYIALQYLDDGLSAVVEMAELYLQKYGKNVSVLRYRATAFDEMKQYGQALGSFQELVKYTPSFEDDLKIGELQMKVGQLKAAESHLQQMLTSSLAQKLDPIHYLLGECSLQAGSYGNATDHYLSAIRLNDTVAKYHYGLGSAYLDDNKPNQALSSFKKAYELGSANASYGVAYARALERKGDIEAALSVMVSIEEYVANNDTSVEYHVLFADLLSNVNRPTEALQEIMIAQSYRPEDAEINQKCLNFRAAAQAQKLTRDIIEVRGTQFYPVFPSLNEYYRTNPIGKITLYNTRTTTISNVEISVFVHDVSSVPELIYVPALIAQQDKVVDIIVDFNERLFDYPRSALVEISLQYEYEGMEYSHSEPRQTLQVLSNKAMDWQNRRSYASFVNPQDYNLTYFVKQNIVQAFGAEPSNALNRNLILALQAYSFYRANGIRYAGDSSTSNLDISALDEVQFPFQLLETQSGDCDDLLVLMAGTLESIGTQTAFIDIPAHVMLAIKIDMSVDQIISNGLDPEYFIQRHNAHWLPLETTMIGKADFVTSWLSAIRYYNRIVEDGVMPEIIVFTEAHTVYPPSSFTKAINSAAYKNVSAARAFYQEDLAGMLKMTQTNQEMDYRAALERYPLNISLKMQYARWCIKMDDLAQAETLLKEIEVQDPQHFNSTLILGNIYAESSRLDLARTQYLSALGKTINEEDQVYRNLCLLEYRDLNRSKALEYFRRLNNKDIIRQVDLQIYADLIKKGE